MPSGPNALSRGFSNEEAGHCIGGCRGLDRAGICGRPAGQDAGSGAAPVAYAPSWTGCYVGGGGGYGLWNQENTGFIDGPPRVPFTATTTAGGRGYLGAVGGGCDYQFPVGAGTALSARAPTRIGAALRASSIPPLLSVWSATRRRAQLGRWAAVSA